MVSCAPRVEPGRVITSVANGKKEDKAGAAIMERLKKLGVTVDVHAVCPDVPEEIATIVKAWAAEGLDLILTTGGTGLSPRDRTPEATFFSAKMMSPR